MPTGYSRLLGRRADLGAAQARGVPASAAIPYLDASQLSQAERTFKSQVDVNGKGMISVDVNAPKGTRITAEGEGLFKKTEINRQTQMEPARGGGSSLPEAI